MRKIHTFHWKWNHCTIMHHASCRHFHWMHGKQLLADRLRPQLSQQKEFRQIKNAVIREAEHIRMTEI